MWLLGWLTFGLGLWIQQRWWSHRFDGSARLLLGGWALQWLGLAAIAVSYRIILIRAGLMGIMCFFGSVLYPD